LKKLNDNYDILRMKKKSEFTKWTEELEVKLKNVKFLPLLSVEWVRIIPC